MIFYFIFILDGDFSQIYVFLVYVTLWLNFKFWVFSIPWYTFAHGLLQVDQGIIEVVGMAEWVGVVETFISFICRVFSLTFSVFLICRVSCRGNVGNIVET